MCEPVIIFKDLSLFSRTKLFTIKGLRFLKHRLAGNGQSLSQWKEIHIPAPQDSERCVEIPWVASAIVRCFGLWLDIGYAHAEPRYWDSIQRNWRRFFRYGYGLDMARPKGPVPLPVHIVADLMEASLDGLPKFDLVTCISTLEHIGCDNAVYLPQSHRRENPWEIQKTVFQKILDQVSAHGHALISVPYGKKRDYGWFIQYDFSMVQNLIDQAKMSGKNLVQEQYYKLDSSGWTRCPQEEMSMVEYHFEESRSGGVALLDFA
jgi:hypothetical protein